MHVVDLKIKHGRVMCNVTHWERQKGVTLMYVQHGLPLASCSGVIENQSRPPFNIKNVQKLYIEVWTGRSRASAQFYPERRWCNHIYKIALWELDKRKLFGRVGSGESDKDSCGLRERNLQFAIIIIMWWIGFGAMCLYSRAWNL